MSNQSGDLKIQQPNGWSLPLSWLRAHPHTPLQLSAKTQ